MIVDVNVIGHVIVDVDVVVDVIVVAHVIIDVDMDVDSHVDVGDLPWSIGADQDDRSGSIIFVSIATIRSSSSIPRAWWCSSISSSIRITSRCAAHSIADPRAIA